MKIVASKHRIYTVVASQKLVRTLCCSGAILCIFLLCAAVFSKSRSLFDTAFEKCSVVFYSLENRNSLSVFSQRIIPDSESILKSASPVFSAVEIKSTPAADEKKQENDAEDSVLSKPLTIEKSVGSVNLEIKNETAYTFSPNALAEENVTYNACGPNPKVLIIHTHACETYSDKNGNGLGGNGSYRTTNASENMIKVGERFAGKLSEYGINAIHDKTLCDYPSYNDSYKNSLNVIERYVKEYPSLEFVFDIHRDALADENDTPVKLIYEKDGKKIAQGMIVCGTDELGLEHPNWRENLTLAIKIQKYLETNYPGYIRPLNLRKERFNMHMTKGSLLFEIGTHANTLEEALLSADILAEAVGEILI